MTNIFSSENVFSDLVDKQRQEEVLSSSVDFYGIFDVLYKLFDKLGVLSTETSSDNAGINFIFGYPDKTFNDETKAAITFDLVERKRLVYDTSAGKITQEKPRELISQNDIVSGQIKTFYSYSYENIIALDVYSTSSERMYQILSYLETVFTKYDGYLQNYFTKLIYLGITSTSGSSHNLFKNRMATKTIMLKIVTDSPYSLLHEEIQKINKQQVNPNYKQG